MIPFAEGLWIDTQPVSIVGTKLTATMTVLRLAGDQLLVYSPIRLTPERRAAVEALGQVAHLYAPNTFHHLHIAEWAAAFPAARVHAAAGLTKKRPDLRIDRSPGGGTPEPAFDGVVEEHHVDGFRLDETVLLYRPAATLLVTDLVHNVGTPEGAWTRLYTRMMGFYGRVALSRALQAMAFFDPAAARRSLDTILALPFDRLIVGHGQPLPSGAREALAAAYAWLPAAAG